MEPTWGCCAYVETCFCSLIFGLSAGEEACDGEWQQGASSFSTLKDAEMSR